MSNQKNFRIHWFWAWVETHDSSGYVGFTQCIFLNFALWGGKGFSVMFHMKILKRRELSDLILHCLVWSPVELSLFTPRTAGFHTCLDALHDFSPLVDLILHKRCKRKPINLCNSLSTSAHSQFLLWRIIKFETRSLGLGSALNFIDSAMSWVENTLHGLCPGQGHFHGLSLPFWTTTWLLWFSGHVQSCWQVMCTCTWLIKNSIISKNLCPKPSPTRGISEKPTVMMIL